MHATEFGTRAFAGKARSYHSVFKSVVCTLEK